MLAILLKTLPFFAVIGLGYWAGRTRFFSPEATAGLTRFVFYFALSAMLFKFASNLSITEIYDTRFALAYLTGCAVAYGAALLAARLRRIPVAEAAMEAQCATIGNTGFLGVPMLVVLMGTAAVGPVLMLLTLDLIVFSTLFTIILTVSRGGRGGLGPALALTLAGGLVRNPMIVSIVLGLAWGATGLAVPAPVNAFMDLLGSAATPGALFAIGASLAGKSAERAVIAGWLAFAKLVIHPAAVAVSAIWIFKVDPYPAAVMIAASALPVAGNVFMLAASYGVAPQRVSGAILISTAVSILTIPLVIALVSAGLTGPLP
jgi:malonate transporter